MKKVIAIIALGITGFAAKAQSPSSTATQTVNLNLSNAIELTFTGSGTATGAAVNLAFNTVNDYANGVASAEQTLRVRSNRRFGVTVRTNNANFTYTGAVTPAPVMPVTGVLDLRVPANGTGGTIASPFSASSYADLSNTAQNLLSNCANGGNQTFNIQYNATPGFAYPAGTYTVDVVYTATQL
ncbi:hypothetical protein CAP35_01140 [Chitinophagaceae bacterium IBVUCB1]|nr:hypothetical protein CAP35_01140 [Chitinophagaceae bacterium IBVUCB1]